MSIASNGGAAAADDFIPPATETAPAEPSATENVVEAVPLDVNIDAGPGQTEIILGAAGILLLAGLLLLLRNAIRRSLIANRATIDSANAAAWTWYFVLLATGSLIIAGVLGGLFGDTSYILITVGVMVVGLIFGLIMQGKAKRSA